MQFLGPALNGTLSKAFACVRSVASNRSGRNSKGSSKLCGLCPMAKMGSAMVVPWGKYLSTVMQTVNLDREQGCSIHHSRMTLGSRAVRNMNGTLGNKRNVSLTTKSKYFMSCSSSYVGSRSFSLPYRHTCSS